MPVQQLPKPDSRRTPPVFRGGLGRALLWPVTTVALGILLVNGSFESDTSADPQPKTRPVAVAPATPKASDSPTELSGSPAELVLPRSEPHWISIPEISVEAPFTRLSLGSSGQLRAPPANDNNLVGWFRGGAAPGERGSSIVVGHVDTKTGPAVFVYLSKLKPGSRVDITRKDGIVSTFKVYSVKTFSKDDFPNKRVYGDAPSPELRLITCGGAYDRKAKEYEANVVAFARLDSAKPAVSPDGWSSD